MIKISHTFWLILLAISLNAQTKQEIYCNENIVWAGIADVDIVIAPDTNTDWSVYKISHLGGDYKQYDRDLKNNSAPLNKIIIENAAFIQFFSEDNLQHTVDYNLLELYDPMYEPDNFGDQEGQFPAAAFDVFRMRCYLYFDRSANHFQISPVGVAVLRSLSDTPTSDILAYETLGWLSIHDWKKDFLNNKNITFAKRFYRDIAFEDVQVMKQEWAIETVMDTFMENIRANANTLELYETTIDSLDGNKRLTADELEILGTDEIMAMTFDSWGEQEKQEFVPWPASDFKGLRLSLDWAWNGSEQTFHQELSAFSILYMMYDYHGEPSIVLPLFLKVFGE